MYTAIRSGEHLSTAVTICVELSICLWLPCPHPPWQEDRRGRFQQCRRQHRFIDRKLRLCHRPWRGHLKVFSVCVCVWCVCCVCGVCVGGSTARNRSGCLKRWNYVHFFDICGPRRHRRDPGGPKFGQKWSQKGLGPSQGDLQAARCGQEDLIVRPKGLG